MTAGTGTFNSLVVVLASEKIQVPYLRFSRHEHLQCSGHKHFFVIFAQCTVISCIYLIIYIFLTMKIFHISASCNNSVDDLLDSFFRDQPLQIQKRDSIVAAQHVDYMDFFFHQFFCPFFQSGTVAAFQCIDDHSRKEEIVGHVTLFCNLFIVLLSVACMDLRKKGQIVFVCQFSYFFQYFPCSRLIQEVFFSRLLRCISKCVQTHDLCSICSQRLQCFVIKLPYQWRFDIQIHLSQIFSLALQKFYHAVFTESINAEF